MQENLGSGLEKIRDTSGKGGGRMLPWPQRRGMCPKPCCHQCQRWLSKRATSPAGMSLPSAPTGPLSSIGTRTDGAKWLLTERSSPCWCPSPPGQAQISLMPGHGLSSPFPAPCPAARIWPEAQPHSFTWRSMGRFLVGTITVHFTLVYSGLLKKHSAGFLYESTYAFHSFCF